MLGYISLRKCVQFLQCVDIINVTNYFISQFLQPLSRVSSIERQKNN